MLAASQYAPSEYTSFISRLSIVITSFSIFGASLKFHSWISEHAHITSRALLGLMIFIVGIYVWLFSNSKGFGKTAHLTTLSVALLPFLAFGISALKNLKAKILNDERFITSWASALSLLVLCGLHILNFADEFLFAQIPINSEHPSLKSALSVSLIVTMIYQYIEQERALAFFGRFIRPGLKSLLRENFQGEAFSDEKMFRPRRIAILKIDIVGHTETTFQMPYGIKRLFQDIWFTTIDQVVADRVFMDKNVGDGSIYCFSEDNKNGTCISALKAAIQIRDEALFQFDAAFSKQLKEFISVTPELKGPATAFFENYHRRTGKQFENRKTIVRIALVFGFVDEGLWGLTSQSHYDVQGDLVSLAARIESKARENEILMDEAFVKECQGYLSNEKISPRLETLKGMGEVKVYALRDCSVVIDAA
jgi:class 3 adenylate cyclase